MRALAAFGLTVVMLVAAEVRAGTVRFTPDHAELDISDPRPVSFEAAIYPTEGDGFTGVDVVFGSELPMTFSITYICDPFPCPFVVFQDSGFYTHDLFVSVSPAGLLPSDNVLGMVQVDPRGASLSIGQIFTLRVDSQFDGLSGIEVNGVWEPLSGRATITVVPEPATGTLVCLLLAAATPPRRHRRRFPDLSGPRVLGEKFACRAGCYD